MRTQSEERKVFGSFNSTGAVLNPGSSDWSCVRTNVGQFTIRFPPFRGIPMVKFTPGGWSTVGPNVIANDTVSVLCWNTTSGSGVDVPVHFEITGARLS